MEKPDHRGESSEKSLIIRQFREGVKRSCGLQIWKEIAKWFDIDPSEHGAVENLAKKLHVKHPVVSEGINYGRLSLELLLTAMTDRKKREFSALGKLPERKQLFIKGYQQAVGYVQRNLLKKKDDSDQLRLEEFCAVCSLLHVMTGRNERGDIDNWSEKKKKAIAGRVRRETAERLGIDEKQVPYQSWKEIEDLRKRWTNEASACLVIPEGWWKWTS